MDEKRPPTISESESQHYADRVAAGKVDRAEEKADKAVAAEHGHAPDETADAGLPTPATPHDEPPAEQPAQPAAPVDPKP